MYEFFMGEMQLPVAPPKLDIKIKNNNKTINLINEGDVNVLKLPGLTEISFDALIPQVKYPFAGATRNASYYLGELERLKVSREPFRFIVVRTTPSGKMLFNTNMNVSLEEYTITEDAKNGLDLKVAIKLKQYKTYATKKLKLTEEQKRYIASVEESRPGKTAPLHEEHVVKEDETVFNAIKEEVGEEPSSELVNRISHTGRTSDVRVMNINEGGWQLCLLLGMNS